MAAEHSIGGRLAVRIMLQALAVLGTVCLGVYWAVGMHMARAHERLLDVKINKLNETAQIMLHADDPRYRELLLANAPRRPGTHLELLHADGRVFYRDEDAADSPNARPLESREKRFTVAFADGSETLRGTYAIDIGPDARTLDFLGAALLTALFLGSASAGFIAHLSVRRGLRPLVDLALQTQRMAPHRLGERLSLDHPAAELKPWIEQFNALMERLEQSYGQLESFNADVAHELRTPLSALMGRTEIALSRERGAEALRETLQSNLEDLQRLSDITNDMLFLSRADRGERARRDAPASLARLVGQVIDFHEASFLERGLSVRAEGDAISPVNEGLFKQAVSNLLDNASRHATPGSTITVHIESSSPEAIRVTVENAGAEVPHEHLQRLFERFFRVDRSRKDGGVHHGLGLAIVAAIARMHHGTALAQSTNGVTRIGFTVAAK